MKEGKEAAMIGADELAALRDLLALASPQALDTAERRADTVTDGEYVDCPCCDGDGSVDAATYTNYDDMAIGVQFFGVGDQFVHNEAAYRALWAATPALVHTATVSLALYAALKRVVDETNAYLGDTPPVSDCWLPAARAALAAATATQPKGE